jgi:hypothetical protein
MVRIAETKERSMKYDLLVVPANPQCTGHNGCHELEGSVTEIFVHDERCPKSAAPQLFARLELLNQEDDQMVEEIVEYLNEASFRDCRVSFRSEPEPPLDALPVISSDDEIPITERYQEIMKALYEAAISGNIVAVVKWLDLHRGELVALPEAETARVSTGIHRQAIRSLEEHFPDMRRSSHRIDQVGALSYDELAAKCDAEMERIKACEHIAEGEEGWEALRDLCPSTMAVAKLRDELEAMQLQNLSNG